VLVELFFENEDIASLARYPVSFCREDEVHTTLGYPSPYSVYTGAPEGVALVTVIYRLHEDFVARLFGVLTKEPQLTRKGVALLRLFIR
jgi:hypothetical protein